MEEQKNHIDRLIEHGGNYLKNRQELLQHTVTEKTLVLSATAISSAVVAAMALFAMVFLGVALALWLGDLMNNRSAGFAIVGGIYVLMTLLILLLKKNLIEKPVMNTMLRQFAEKQQNAVRNIDDLRSEMDRLKTTCAADEVQIKKDIDALRNDLKPENMLLNLVSGITGIRFDRSSTGKGGILYGISLLMQRLMIRAEKKAEDAVYSLVDVLFQRIQDFVHKHTTHEAKREERGGESKQE
jgi:hypothetical protein